MVAPFVKLYHAKRLQRKLSGLKRADKRAAVRKAARESAKPLHQATVQASPERTGLLKRAIKLRAARRSRVRVGVNVIVRKLDLSKAADKFQATKTFKKKFGNRTGMYKVFYAGFVELGTKKQKAQHFMRQTARRMKRKVTKDFMKRVYIEIERIAKR